MKEYDPNIRRKQKHIPNDEYENFANAHLEAAAECIPTKQRAKPKPWETLAVRKNRKNTTNTNAMKLEKAQNELDNIY